MTVEEARTRWKDLQCPVCLKVALTEKPGYEFDLLGTRWQHIDYFCFRSISGMLELTLRNPTPEEKEKGLPNAPL